MMDIRFEAIRSDWYASNTLLPRLAVNAILGKQPFKLVGFPAQWIPVCVHYGFAYAEPRLPTEYLPIFSDLSPAEIGQLAEAARAHQASRSLLEATAALDAVIADLIYIVDHKLAIAGFADPASDGVNVLNTWHSFGRPEIIHLQENMARQAVATDAILMLPCSRRRPYQQSRTHTRLMRQLAEAGYDTAHFGRVVVTALGVVPADFWRHPLVMSYDAGAVDLWRVFQLLRTFLTLNPAPLIVDCLSFKPYSDMLGVLRDLGIVKKLVRPLKLRWRAFHVDQA